MRILVVSQYFWPENFRINDLVQGLVARGHGVTVLTGLPNYPEGTIPAEYRQAPGRYLEYQGARIHRVPILPRGQGRVRLALNYLSFLVSGMVLGPWRLSGQAFDAIFVFQTSPITVAFPALLLGRIKRVPTVMWVLDLWPGSLSAVGAVRSRWLLGAVGAWVTFIYRHCDRILVQSRAFMADIERHGGDPARVRYFPGWAEDLFCRDPARAEPAPEMAPHTGCFNVVFAGNIGDAQDFPAILEAVEALADRPDVRWIIVGEGRAASWVRREVARRSLGDRVFLVGCHPIERIPGFFRLAGALLVSLKRSPVFSLTIPGKVQSYLASGLPLLGMLDGEGARTIREAGAGLVAPSGDGAALAACVRTLADMPEAQRRAMGRSGRRYAQATFGRDALLGHLEAWLEELRAERASMTPR